jgi:hypothetical protein
MYEFEQQINVLLEFPAMTEPISINVPWTVLRYLDFHADRRFAPDGTVIYKLRNEPIFGSIMANMPEERRYVLA